MSLNPVPPSSADWNAWVTLTRHVDAALAAGDIKALFSARAVVATSLWESGYRPTPEQVAEVIEEDRRRERERRESEQVLMDHLRDIFGNPAPTTRTPEESPNE